MEKYYALRILNWCSWLVIGHIDESKLSEDILFKIANDVRSSLTNDEIDRDDGEITELIKNELIKQGYVVFDSWLNWGISLE